MLQLKNITKNYEVADQTVQALRGVSISFRKSEFVSILGPSGCGKTTLLNIIGGLDRYTTGDIVINGRSTKLYSDSDWDAYRNHSIGFVFQSYNLIPHQTVLSNVELALTLSGTGGEERKKKAVAALEKVGLKDHINKLPNQLSGGQMQRVAIARAIVNDPEIILADEPTGALDTETSVQVMDILKEIANERLVIMVTHNPELAKLYSTRIIMLKDGAVRDDSNPFEWTEVDKIRAQEEEEKEKCKRGKKAKKRSMSLLTALSLSLNNLGTKKARTALTSFAGSIGIIGIALILSLSSGFNTYIDTVQKDVLSNYPVTVSKNSLSMTSYATTYFSSLDRGNAEKYPSSDGKITTNDMIGGMIDSASSSYGTNDISSFKTYLEENDIANKYADKISAIRYDYSYGINVYRDQAQSATLDETERMRKVNSVGPLEQYIGEQWKDNEIANTYYRNFQMMMGSSGTWGELFENDKLIKSQYDLLAGSWPTNAIPENGKSWPLVVVVDEYNSIPDYSMYYMGLMSDENVKFLFSRMITTMLTKMQNPDWTDDQVSGYVNKVLAASFSDEVRNYQKEFTLAELLGKKYSLLLNGQYYEKDESVKETVSASESADGKEHTVYHYESKASDGAFVKNLVENESIPMEIVGIIRLKKGVSGGALSSNIYYTAALNKYLLNKTNELSAVKNQNEATDVMLYNGSDLKSFDTLKLDSDGKLAIPTLKAELMETESALGLASEDDPYGISIFPSSFENKDFVVDIINKYNEGREENQKLHYTDYVGMMMSSITTIINAITYVLIAFVSISLIVSSIMIGVITYISVLERTKEIGILRSIGASKRDIKHVFNAETMIIGFISGALGIIITVLLDIPISLIINALAGIPHVATLPWLGGLILVLISVTLTLISGLIPAGMASKRDPVIALRSE